ncbi:alpha/beta hydrolase [Parabacteroides sp. OttesenSCG-928-N08]|nr:alpha/beta hydrolase [Parabacteroides sp. OttesenSCG-928-N08]
MKRYILLACCALLMTGCLKNQPKIGQEVTKSSLTYSIKETDTLRLDKYEIAGGEAARPCVIFLFGGGFSGGAKEQEGNVRFMESLAQLGYVAVAIDYRLGMKDFTPTGDGPLALMAMASRLTHSVKMATEDLYDATTFVYEHAREWNINSDWLVACGSSAGALAVLQGEFYRVNNDPLAQKLPKEFKYGGVIAFAGAIYHDKGALSWSQTPAPMLLFHGDADKNVPYKSLTFGAMGLHGSHTIVETLAAAEYPYYFVEVNNAAHEISGTPMGENLGEIKTFIDQMVVGQKPWMIHSIVQEKGKPELDKEVSFTDFIHSNYP